MSPPIPHPSLTHSLTPPIHNSIKTRFGPFPTFWQDLLTWEHTRALQKLYLRWMDTGASAESLLKHLDSLQNEEQEAAADGDGKGKKGEEEAAAAAAAEAAPATATNGDVAAAPAPATEANGGDGGSKAAEEAAAPAKKRKSRWGDDGASASSTTTTTTTGRKSRWGDAAPAAANENGKKSRWSQPDPAALLAAAQPQLAPDTVQEIIALQLRLDDIHRRQLTLPADALARESVRSLCGRGVWGCVCVWGVAGIASIHHIGDPPHTQPSTHNPVLH